MERFAGIAGVDERLVCGLCAAGSSLGNALAKQFPAIPFIERTPDGGFDLAPASVASPLVAYLPLGAALSRPPWEEISASTQIVPWVPLVPALPEYGQGHHSVAAGGWLASTALLRRLRPYGGSLGFASLWQIFRSQGIDVCFRAPPAMQKEGAGPRVPDLEEGHRAAIGADASVLALVPHFGCEAWLEQALASLVTQSRPLDGIVVLDDASDLPPVDIVRRFPGVTLVTARERSGPYRLIQSAMGCAEYDAYLFQDADDWSAADRLELLLREAGRTGAELIGCQEIRIDEDTGSVQPVCYPLDVTRSHKILPSYALLHPSSLVAKSLVDRIGGYATSFRFSGDTEFLYRAAHATRAVNIDRYAYFRRARAGSLTSAPETGLGSAARLYVNERVTGRALDNAALVSRGMDPDLTPLGSVADVAFEHVTGPPLTGRRRAFRRHPVPPPPDMRAAAPVPARPSQAGTPPADPFACTADAGFLTLMRQLGCTLAVSTYQAGKLIFLGLGPDGGLTQLPRTFDKPMGLAVDGARLAVATRNETILLADAPLLAAQVPGRPGIYDGLYLPRATFHTGEVDFHDLAWVGADLLGVATRLSCIAAIDTRHSLRPLWRPPFITDLTPDDRCHLNGMAVADGAVRYATALGATDSAFGWRPTKAAGGVLLEVPSGRVVLDGLSMPHSPRLAGGQLYVLNSGTGEVLAVDPVAGRASVLARLPGFLRGLAIQGDLMFVGLSRLRDGRAFDGLPLEASAGELMCGVAAIDRRAGRQLGMFAWQGDLQELYDVQIIPGRRRAGVLGTADDRHRGALALPEAGFWSERIQG